MSMQPVPWPDPDPVVAAAIRGMYGSRKTEPPLAVTVRDRLGEWLHDEDFAAVFGIRGRPGWSPSRLALVTVLTGYPARLAGGERRLSVRVEPDGGDRPAASPPDPSWLQASVEPTRDADSADGAGLWLECPSPPGPVEAMVLDRAAVAARAVLSRTRGRAPDRMANDEAAVEVVIDPGASPAARRYAARVVGLTGVPLIRAIALADRTRVVPTICPEPMVAELLASDGRRAGIGTVTDLDGLPASWTTARLALRLTAEGTNADPGPRCVRYEDLGALALLAENVSFATPVIPDEFALDRAAVAAPWMLETLHAVAVSASLRAAAGALLVHHSTLQGRIEQAERLLGWPVRDPAGCHRLYLALALRRLRRHLPSQ